MKIVSNVTHTMIDRFIHDNGGFKILRRMTGKLEVGDTLVLLAQAYDRTTNPSSVSFVISDIEEFQGFYILYCESYTYTEYDDDLTPLVVHTGS